MIPATSPRKRGRPAAFDYDIALDQAMRAFWQYGYEGTSMRTLMAVMQMNKASIYAAYGSKEVLFQKAVERYVSGPASFISQALQQPTAYAVITQLLQQAAICLTDAEQPHGCLVIQGALSCSEEAQSLQTLLSQYRLAVEQKLTARLLQAQAAGEIAATVDVAVVAKLVMAIHQGMSVQATTGATAAQLSSMATLAARSIAQQTGMLKNSTGQS